MWNHCAHCLHDQLLGRGPWCPRRCQHLHCHGCWQDAVTARASPSVYAYRTKSGRMLTDADLQDLAEEAERGYEVSPPPVPGDRARAEAAERLLRDVLEALCESRGLPLESDADPGSPARNYELALRLGIGRVFGLGS